MTYAPPCGRTVYKGSMTDATLPQSLDWITRLCRVDSTSRLSNAPVIELLVDALREHGIEPQLFDSPDGTKQGLVATIPAADGTTTGGVVLSGHTDVVPVDGQDWSSDPFEPEVRDGRLYCRGGADMKSFLGVVMHKVPALKAAGLAQPVHLAFSYDEEVGCRGGDAIVAKINELGLAPRGAVIGEPSSMRIIRAHKSVNMFRATFTGVNAHSSLTSHGVNAIEYAAQLVPWWRGMVDGWKTDGPFDDAYPLPYSTGGINQFDGGTAVNIVPSKASLVLEFRTIAAVDPQQVLADTTAKCDELRERMKAENSAADVELVVDSMVPGLDTPADAWVAQLAQRCGATSCDDKVTYGTEAGQFARGGIPAVVCGPGDIAQAHTADEWIELDQILDCEAFVDALAQQLASRD